MSLAPWTSNACLSWYWGKQEPRADFFREFRGAFYQALATAGFVVEVVLRRG
jgi:hypothetical protein